MNKNINLREIKKARTKLLLLQTTTELAGKGEMRNFHIEDICRNAEVSKVTFFNYFSQKEELFSYYMAIWGFHRAVDYELQPDHGIEGIRRIYHRAAEDAKEHPGMFLSLIRFLANEPACPAVPELTEAEKQVLYPEHNFSNITLPHLYQQFQNFTTEAYEMGEVRTDFSTSQLTHMVITIFYGAFLTAHSLGISDKKAYYDLHLNLILSQTEIDSVSFDPHTYWDTTGSNN
ncbi:TetR/AcrR family transcriptional regulator [Salibacterium salarium]|uniref:TetR/AcrR family transcriptional regulator n=1 Tax=Salibacterium salarium TaxID=284579 RepID=A0A428N6H7_9BACI|nr:TetR/AcrR family transcriptional regulator [Salibacterium salarium]RSL34011.1 TetR/AcrR family transcriptional regulator [Salibacterium salarium]